jgi:hypothetical protein
MRRHLAAFAVVIGLASPAQAQQPSSPSSTVPRLQDVLSFLLTNRSIPTGDFAGDAQAASAARDAVAGLLLAELGSLPTTSPASGFTYRLDPTLGTSVRSSENFGPFFVERSLTAGKGQSSFGLGHTVTSFHAIDGRSLRDGTLVSTASRLVSQTDVFDAETLTLRMRTRSLTASALVGVTDRLDLSAVVPLVSIDFDGERVDTYRGTSVVQATAVASSAGLGDVLLRAKYNAWRSLASGLAVAGEVRLPTGNTANLLGAGEAVFTPRVIASAELEGVSVHGNLGYSTGGASKTVDYAGALAVAAAPRLTIVVEALGRRVDRGGRLAYVTALHPSLVGIETIRLSSTAEPTGRLAVVAGFRWNVAQRLLANMNVVRPLTSAGLRARWVPTITLDYALGH